MTQSYKEREEWLNGLKADDLVVEHCSATDEYFMRKVASVSPSRSRIQVGGRAYNGKKDGSEIGELYSRWSILPNNEETAVRVKASRLERERARLANSLDFSVIKSLDFETLTKIANLVTEAKAKKDAVEAQRMADFEAKYGKA